MNGILLVITAGVWSGVGMLAGCYWQLARIANRR